MINYEYCRLNNETKGRTNASGGSGQIQHDKSTWFIRLVCDFGQIRLSYSDVTILGNRQQELLHAEGFDLDVDPIYVPVQ